MNFLLLIYPITDPVVDGSTVPTPKPSISISNGCGFLAPTMTKLKALVGCLSQVECSIAAWQTYDPSDWLRRVNPHLLWFPTDHHRLFSSRIWFTRSLLKVHDFFHISNCYPRSFLLLLNAMGLNNQYFEKTVKDDLPFTLIIFASHIQIIELHSIYCSCC